MKTYYAVETKQALENFPNSMSVVQHDLIYALAIVKKAAAIANARAGVLDVDIAKAISQTCDVIRKGRLDEQFVTPALQGGAGTSINMNVNEVIASYATKVLRKKGKRITVHYLDHVNRSQSTNDVNPTALKIATIKLIQKLALAIESLVKNTEKKAQTFTAVKKLGRTHLQDAVPTTLGAEFQSYADILKRGKYRIEQTLASLYELGLGGTAIGNSINASKDYQKFVYQELRSITKFPIKPASNFMPQTSSQTDFAYTSASVWLFLVDLSKIASDLRLLASGPRGGLGEIALPELQKGSSVMPGKVNPVIPESVNQTYFLASGFNMTIHQAAQASQLELGIMFPILADALLRMLKVTIDVVIKFDKHCVSEVRARKTQCTKHLERSTAYATLLTPVLGYDKIDKAVKEALAKNKTIREVILEKKLLTNEEFDKIIKNSL